MKKVMELSQLFNLGIFLVIHDHEFNKIYEYNSGTYESGLFQIDDAYRALKLGKNGEVQHKYFTNDDYVKFKSNKFSDNESVDSKIDPESPMQDDDIQ